MVKSSCKAALKKMREYINQGFATLSQFYKNMSIRIKLMVILNIVILIPLLIISFVCYKNSENVLKDKSVQYSQDILKIIDLRVNDYIADLNSITRDILEDTTVSNYIQKDKDETDLVKVYHDKEEVRNVLKDKIRSKGGMQSISIFVGDLHCYADDSTQSESIEDIVPFNSVPYHQMLKMAYKSEGAPIWYLENSGDEPHIFYARSIIDRNTYENSGILIVMVNTSWFKTVFSGLVNDDMKKTAIISKDKQVVLSQAGAEDYQLSDELFEEMSYDHGWIADNEQNTLISYVTVSKTGWKIVSYIPLSVLFRDVEDLKHKIILALVCAVLFLLLVSFYISFDFVASINKIVDGMTKLKEGQENVSVELKRKDELGFMGDTFNKMVKEITTLQKWVLREQLTRKDSQIKALQSQINPHFLFNTLETINWMAQLNHAPEISETVTALASLMEASMARTGKYITLGEEFRYIDNYILILKKRFGDRLELIKEIDERVLGVKVPRLLIQPLVENAANHGVANMRSKGIVRLTAVKSGDFVNITVEDNGVGIDPDELEMINERLAMNDDDYFKEEENNRRHGIGLENVNRRIKLFYGQQYGLKIESKEGCYTRVYVDIPLEANDKTHDNPD